MLSRAWVPLAVAALVSACATSPKPPPAATADLAVLLPGADGTTGALVITQGTNRAVLSAPYESAEAAADRQLYAGRADEAQIKQQFGSALGALPPPPAAFVVYFVLGRDEFTEESRKEVNAVLEEVSRRPSPEVTVIGHADQLGSDPMNDALSLTRAQRVRELLVQRGISAERISIAGRGKREPLVPTRDGTSEARNRRVEISVR